MADIGQILKNARKEKGLTLDDLQQTTKIQKRYLIAIEEDNFDSLPGKFYVRAFIKQYAETVGLDAEELLAELDTTANTAEAEKETEAKTRTEAVKREEKPASPVIEKIIHYLPTIIIVLIVGAILGTIYIFAWGDRNKNESTQIAQTSQKVSVSSETTAAKESSSSAKKASSQKETAKKASSSTTKKTTKKTKQTLTNTAANGSTFTYTLENAPAKNKLELAVSDGATAWNAVSANGVQVWQGTLSATSTKETVEIPENTTTITLSLGNSKATTIKVNGKKFDFLKENDTLTVRTITINVASSSANE